MKKVSFVVPVKNGEKFIKKTIDSLLAQSYDNVEIVISNDHSTDSTVDIIKHIARDKNNFTILNNPKGITGEAATRNYATSKSSGDIILPTDADDPNEKNRAEVTVDEINRTNADIFYATLTHYYEEKQKSERRFFQPYKKELLRHINYINHAGSSGYTKKTFTRLGGYDENIKIGTDYDLWLRAQEMGLKFCFQNKALARYTIHSGQMTNVNIHERHKWLKIIRKKHSIFSVSEKYVRDNANKKTVDIFINNKYYRNIWFSDESIPRA